MKIAVLFFGQPRFLQNKESSDSHHKFIFSRYDKTDVFVHSWWVNDEEDYIPSSWSQLTNVSYNRHVIRNVRDLYNPAHAVYERPMEFTVDLDAISKVDFIKSQNDLNNIKSHLFSIKRVGEIFKDYADPSEYNFIILSRFDNVILDFPDLRFLQPGFYRMADHPGTADQLFIFSPEYMEFLNVYDHHDELNEKGADYTLEKMKLIHFESTFPGKGMDGANFQIKLVRSCG